MAKYLGIDYGQRRIGLAVSDPTGIIARSLSCIDASKSDVLTTIPNIIAEHGIEHIVIGLPKNMDGSLGEQAQATIRFSQQLKTRISIPFTLWDERLSTMQAKRVLIEADMSRKKRKKVIDGLAAQLILQNFLDRENHK